MKPIIALFLGGLLILGPAPTRADFKYTDTSKITGGALKSMMKTVGFFSKQASEAMKPVVTTHYVKGNKLRTDRADGTIEIIDVDGRRVVEIDSKARTYREATFDEIKAAMQKAQEDAAKKMQQDPKTKDIKANVDAKVYVTPSKATREILGQTAKERKMEIELEITAQDAQGTGQQGQPVTGTITTAIDSWIAAGVPGYQEIGQFYVRMAKEINWVPPPNIRIDPRVTKSMEAMQRKESSLKGLPLLQYVSMTMVGQQGTAGAPPQDASGGKSSTSSDDSSSSPSQAIAKGLGSLFGKKKKKDDAADSNSQNPPPPSTPGALIEMTIEVNSFSDAALEGSLFEVPAGYARVEGDPGQILGLSGKK
jgi:hypothetical protein